MACCDASPVPYDVNVESGPEVVAYDGSVVSNPEARQTLKTLRPVITLRPKHGYSATKYVWLAEFVGRFIGFGEPS